MVCEKGLLLAMHYENLRTTKTVTKTEMIVLLMELMMGMRPEKRMELEQSLLVSQLDYLMELGLMKKRLARHC